ncbi:hypothetical protein SAMN02745691_01610 [Parasporobacterium paucivorans DSM 15970]|uniref:DUF7479 domain-containing protein n=1 Tax=Parasporobacterium paucivorans DSM 15970 TaxID=1122934 RepID=A0A1M6HUK9_9FIRM|nr:hypothetical protein [Parasporobacterium paucivorans]SHJ25909.1 hypothetical protein SAMN02745691_01610 [Parasporobacterium paucivorans DSM 15970]
MSNSENQKLICEKCNVELQLKKTKLTYLEHQVIHELPCCPPADRYLFLKSWNMDA